MNPDYIIVQAGGRGSRMDYLTDNKPKALVPIGKKPMIFHLFDKFPDKKYIIIGDYQIDVLRIYLETFAKVEYIVVDGARKKGTSAGIRKALDILPPANSFMLIWSDLVLPASFSFPDKEGNYVGLSKSFECRWKFENGRFLEKSSTEFGVAGLFLFRDKSSITDVPDEGEFVRWISEKGIQFDVFGLYSAQEFGLIEKWKDISNTGLSGKCRPFNQITEKNGILVKEGIDDQGKALAVREQNWYQFAQELGYTHIPRVFDIQPLTMERINGRNIYEYESFSVEKKKEIIKKLVSNLKDLHSLAISNTDYFSIIKNFYTKTFERINKVRNLIPFANREHITVNKKRCRNVFFYQKELWQRISKYKCKRFCFIHGDCTFSNMMLDENENPVLIDPRGYFGNIELFGDPAYDWAKIYYSIIGNYDRFNLKRFRLIIKNESVQVNVDSNQWESVADYYLSLIADDADANDIKLIHAIIWLSLTTYAWEDYDSICAAFYLGLYYLEEVL